MEKVCEKVLSEAARSSITKTLVRDKMKESKGVVECT